VTAPYWDVVRGMQQVKLHRGRAELSASSPTIVWASRSSSQCANRKVSGGASARALWASASARVARPFDFRALVESWSLSAISPNCAIV